MPKLQQTLTPAAPDSNQKAEQPDRPMPALTMLTCPNCSAALEEHRCKQALRFLFELF